MADASGLHARLDGWAAAPQNARSRLAATCGTAADHTATRGAAAGRPAANVPCAVDLVTTDVIARDGQGQFISDLKTDEFEVYEDGVRQEIVSLVLTHGGRVFNCSRLRPPPSRKASSFRPRADERRRRTCVSDFHRRPAPRFPHDAAHARSHDAHAAQPGSRWRHVRDRVDRNVLDLRAAHLRSAGPRVVYQAGGRERPQA